LPGQREWGGLGLLRRHGSFRGLILPADLKRAISVWDGKEESPSDAVPPISQFLARHYLTSSSRIADHPTGTRKTALSLIRNATWAVLIL
jgi:hypothetical protein